MTMTIKVLGPVCRNCVILDRVTRDAVAHLGLDAIVAKVEDYQAIMDHGVMSTPALVIDEEPPMIIKILGSGCANCVRLEANTKQALAALGLEATVEKVTDFGDIASYGVMKTPGLVVDEQVLVSGRVPDAAEITNLLTPTA